MRREVLQEYGIVLLSVLLCLILQVPVHEVGHAIFLALHGIPFIFTYGMIYGRYTFYLDTDVPQELAIYSGISGGFFAGLVFLVLSIRFRAVLWVSINQFNIALWEPILTYTGFWSYGLWATGFVEVLLILSTLLYYTMRSIDLIDLKVVWK